jgi:hypothetical protein
MFPFLVESTWYERYWLRESPPPARRIALQRLAAVAQRMAAMMISTALTLVTISALQ